MYNKSEKIRNELMDYYGTAMHSGNPLALIDLVRVERASKAELQQTARQNGFNLSQFDRNPRR